MNHSITSAKIKYWYCASFMIPLGICVLSMLVVHVYPFGDNTLLLRDAADQYIAFTSYLKTIFSAENNLLYTFSKNLGGEMVSLFAYYLISPFNILFAFFDTPYLPFAFTLVILLKISASGFTFFLASGKIFGGKPIGLAFSTAYALMAYNTIYGWNIMWLDGVLILPLLIYGIYQLWNNGSIRLYCITLAYSLLTNFYIGYMLCITSVLLFFCLMILKNKSAKENGIALGKFTFASLISGFSSAFIWLPSFLAIMGGRGQYAGNIFTDGRFYNFNFLGIAAKVLVGSSSPSQVSTGTPHIYCGILAIFCVILLLVNRKIPVKNRILCISVIVFFLLSFLLRIPNVIWHGFTQNYAFNFRYAFIFSCLLLMMAQDSLQHMFSVDKRWVLGAFSLILLLILGVAGMKYVMDLDFVSITGCLISVLTLLIITAFFRIDTKLQERFLPLLIAFLLLETGCNYAISLHSIVEVDHALSAENYTQYVQQTTPAVEFVEQYDDSFFRMEKTFQQNHNDSMTFSYNGLTHFSSSQQGNVPRFMEKMGFLNCRDIWSYYHTGSTTEAESLLGVSYVLSKDDLSKSKGYNLLSEINGIGIYKNPYAIPIAVLADASVTDVNMDNSDYFSLHNDIWSGIVGKPQSILKPAEFCIRLNNMSGFTQEDGSILYCTVDISKPASVIYDVVISSDDPLYFYFTAPGNQDVQLAINGIDQGEYFSLYRWDMTYSGSYQIGDHITVELIPMENTLSVTDAYFYHEDRSALADTIASVQGKSVSFEQHSSSRFSGTFHADSNQKILFTIPADKGWTLYVDGQQVQTTSALELFFCADVPSGIHRFELKYSPPGLWAGILLSAGSLVLGFGYYIFCKQKSVY